MAQTVDELKVAREKVLTQLTRAGSTIKLPEVESWDKAVLSLKRGILEKAWEEYQVAHTALMSHPDTTNDQLSEFDAQAVAAARVYSQPRALIDVHLAAIQGLASTSICRPSEISVPIFNGAYTSWVPWRSEFLSKVKNAVLPPGDKIDLLRSALAGEARGRIGEPDRRDAAEFEAMWQLLESTYDHQYQIIVGHINTIMDLKPMPMASATDMRKIIDVLDRELRALQRFEYDTDGWSPLLAVMVLRKLDRATLEEWEKERVPTDKPVLADLKKFMEKRILMIRNLEFSCRNDEDARSVIEARQSRAQTHETRNVNSRHHSAPNPFAHQTIEREDGKRSWKRSRPVEERINIQPNAALAVQLPVCKLCEKGPHHLWFCKKFKAWSLAERLQYVENRHLCPCCLKVSVGGRSTQVSKQNLQPIGILIEPAPGAIAVEVPQPVPEAHHVIDYNVPAVLGTAVFRLQCPNGKPSQVIRALCDSGSQINLIKKQWTDNNWTWGIDASNASILGVGLGSQMPTHGQIDASLMHHTQRERFITGRFMIIPKITGNQPHAIVDVKLNGSLPHHQLADPDWCLPGKVDALIGAGTLSMLIMDGIVRLEQDGASLLAQNSALGWIISGHYASNNSFSAYACNQVTCHTDLDQRLRQFWELPNEDEKSLTHDQQLVENNFLKRHERASCGRYIVSLPFRQDVPPLGRSRHIAMKRLLALEARLAANPQMADKCHEFWEDYIQKGHLVPAGPPTPHPSASYYIPYHVIQSKKFRIVFDGSCASSTGISVNDLQYTGAKLQADLGEILLAFRNNRYALTADIVQMFRQVQMTEKHWNFQRILWRRNPSDPVQECFITCVVWGYTSATFNAVRALRQCAIDNGKDYPLAAAATLSNFYVDDLLTGAHSFEEIDALRKQLTDMLTLGGFPLAKWTSNHVDMTDERTTREVELQHDPGVLGMSWVPSIDKLHLKLDYYDPGYSEGMTKRQLISRIAQVYDPNGFLAPVTIVGKILIQDAWKLKLDWDHTIPSELCAKWHEFHASILQLDRIMIPRWNGYNPDAKCSWHVFCDASEAAYGACIYLRVEAWNGKVSSHLVSSRTKVTPIQKPITIPRLELLGATMAVDLFKYVDKACQLKTVPVQFWTDSMIVLHWLRKNSETLKPFVANRVKTILESSDVHQWRHVPGISNPADLLSRGATYEQFCDATHWWHGPTWLCENEKSWPTTNSIQISSREKASDDEESRGKLVGLTSIELLPTIIVVNEKGQDELLLDRISTLSSLERTTAFVFRFIKNMKSAVARTVAEGIDRRTKRTIGSIKEIPAITVNERQEALQFWCIHQQKGFFSREWQALRSQKELPTKSSLRQLCPCLDNNGVLRVGGRLHNAEMPEDNKHPIILASLSRLALLVVQHTHQKTTMHAGTQLTMSTIRQRFWIPQLRVLVRTCIRKCTICIRYRKTTARQMMGTLPTARVTRSDPFSVSGLDFAGPYSVRRNQGRATRGQPNTTEKVWICIFVCMSTKAVHLDLAYGLSTEAFLDTFARFVSRRGLCKELWSDNGTGFVGANNELKRVLEEWKGSLPHQQLANYQTVWNFIPPGAPHQGGLWEAGVKSVKHHLRRTIGVRILTPTYLYTLLTRVEACLNSRPLGPISQDATDPSPLTPGHFLIGRPLLQPLLTENVSSVPDNRLTAWAQQQKLIASFWRRWKDDYLVSLQSRLKWSSLYPNIEKGTAVLILDENTPPASWPLGEIIEVLPGPDDLVRIVKIKIRDKTILTRAITKVIPLFKIEDTPPNTPTQSGSGFIPSSVR